MITFQYGNREIALPDGMIGRIEATYRRKGNAVAREYKIFTTDGKEYYIADEPNRIIALPMHQGTELWQNVTSEDEASMEWTRHAASAATYLVGVFSGDTEMLSFVSSSLPGHEIRPSNTIVVDKNLQTACRPDPDAFPIEDLEFVMSEVAGSPQKLVEAEDGSVAVKSRAA